MGRVRLFAVVTLVVLSGCTLPASPDRFDTDRELGYVGEYAHDDVFEFDGEDGLTEAQLEAVAYRSMARIEVLRGQKFARDVDLEVISRAEYRERRGEPYNASPFANELWRGTFVVGDETDANRALDDLYGDAVQGYYADGRIVIVADDADEIRISRRVLVHELVHALQDQHFGLDRRGDTLDERRAELGLLEGEADYVPHLYERRCGDQWQCLPEYERPPTELGDRPFNLGLFLSIYAPYAEGPSFVAHLHETGGWERVDRAHGDRPTSTSQVIHPDRYPDAERVAVEIEDRSSDAWEPYADNGDPRTETVGEATLFATLWANGVIDRPLTDGATDLSPYNYAHPLTDGWTGDAFRVYHDEDDRTAHVWRLAWEDEDDAEAFADAYRDLLEANDAEAVDTNAYRVDDGSFDGAYRVTVTNETVEIVGVPSVDDLEGVHAADPNTAATAAAIGPEGPEGPEGADPNAATTAGPTRAADGAPADG